MTKELYQNTKGYTLPITVTDKNGNAVDLTNSTITIVVGLADETPLFSGACVITDAEAGTCSYTVADGDLDAAGHYEAQLNIVWTDDRDMVANIEDLKILKKLGS